MILTGDSETRDRAGMGQVRDFYDRYPYPPPVTSLDAYRRLWQDRARRRADHHLHWPAKAFTEEHSILVAGCGTSQAAKHALRWPSARVVGVDFSATGVRCTEDLKRRYRIDNLEVRQLAVERVAELETSFDRIVCTGVLHHLADPDAGLRALRDVLAPGGAMHLMVYAPYGRSGVYMLQDFCRRLGIHATDGDIRDLITALASLPRGHPLEALLREAPDFRDEAALADALLHPQDRAYSVPQWFDFLERGGLRFGRWVRQAPYSARCGVLAQIPQSSRIAGLPLPESFAAAELFRGTMVRHSAIAYRNDSPLPQTIGFAGDDWPGFVPVRMPDTVCVAERLPAGASAVLINSTHTYRDIYLPIDATEKHLFDAIDGKRSVSRLMEATVPAARSASSLDAMRDFVERLWWHDQIVFDASRTPHRGAVPAPGARLR